MILEVVICTIDERVNDVQELLLPLRKDVAYSVVHQDSGPGIPMPEFLKREDIRYFTTKGSGVTRSRNYGIWHSRGDILLMADDDARYTNEYFDTVLHTFRESGPDMALFKIKTLPGQGEYKDYPKKELKMNVRNLHSISSLEIAFFANKVKDRVYFDERLGLQGPIPGGEEYLFVRDAIRAGLNVWYYPRYVAIHPENSTLKALPKYHDSLLSVEGAYYARLFGLFGFPRIIRQFFLRRKDLQKHHVRPGHFLRTILRAYFYMLLAKPVKPRYGALF
jgi:glycosyltransferase involved in cell wall biosynthesis